MKTVVLSGYYGFNNAGDEALLAAIAGTLRELKPELKIIVLSASPTQTQRLHGIEAVSRVNPFALIKTLIRADLLISGGGSLLQDVTSWRSILYYLGIVTLGLILGTPVMFYAQGIGPIRRPWARWLTRVIANRVQQITVRDEDSRRELQFLGVTVPPIRVTADPVLGMSFNLKIDKDDISSNNFVDKLNDITDKSINKLNDHNEMIDKTTGNSVRKPVNEGSRGRVGFALRNWQGLVGFKEASGQAADYFIEQGWEVVFIPFHYPDDLAAARDVAGKMRYSVKINEERSSVWTVMQEIGNLDLLIGMRLHSLIFAATLGVPMLGIAYDPKVTGFMEQLGEKPVGQVEELTSDQLIKGVSEIIQRLPEARSRLLQEAERLGELARDNARLALKLLNMDETVSLSEDQEPANILGAHIDRLDMQHTITKISEFIGSSVPHHVITLNAEIIYQAQHSLELLNLINQADLVTPDGAGVVWASSYLGQPTPERVTGIDLVLSLCPVAEAKGYKIFLLGAAPGVAEEASQKLQEVYPNLQVVGCYHGYFQPNSEEERKILRLIEHSRPDLLLVALGAPRQEFWIRQQIDQGTLTVPVSIGVGGSLDVIAGRVERAPAWMCRLKLEWLGRLIREPRRWRRMLALPKFVIKVLRQEKIR